MVERCKKQQPRSIKWRLMRARIISNRTEKFQEINDATQCDDESSEAFRRLGEWYREQIDYTFENEKSELIDKAINAYKKSLQLEPSKKNLAWSNLHSLYRSECSDKSKKNSLLNDLEERLAEQGLHGWRLLTLKSHRIERDSEKVIVDKLIAKIADAELREFNNDRYYFKRLMLNVYTKIGDAVAVKRIVEELIRLRKHKTDAGLALDISNSLRKIQANDSLAKEILLENLNSDEFDADVFIETIGVHLSLGLVDEAERIFKMHKDLINEIYELKLQKDIQEAGGFYAQALGTLEKIEALQEKKDIVNRSYLLLMDKKYDQAKKVCQDYLEMVNYSSSAVVEIVNFELARKRLGAKPDNGRLDSVLKFSDSMRTKAAVAALKGHKKEAIEYIKDELRFDKTFRIEVERWPVFEDLRNEDILKETLGRLNSQ